MTPFLYILMRTDLASMNAGKAVAQGAHAANVFQTRIQEGSDDGLKSILREWQEDRMFGTTITLGVNEAQMTRIVDYQQNFMAARGTSIAGLVLY